MFTFWKISLLYFRKQLHCFLFAFQNKQFSFTFAAHLILERHEKKCRNKSSKLHPFYLGKKHYKTWRKIQTKTKLENLRSLKMRVWIYFRFWINWNYKNEENWKYLYCLKMYEFYWKYLKQLKLFQLKWLKCLNQLFNSKSSVIFLNV